MEVFYPDGWQILYHPLRVVDQSGQVVAREGDTLRVSGGVSGLSVGESACAPGPPLPASSVERIDTPSLPAAPSMTPTTSPPPSGGISKDRAIAVARTYKSLTTTFVSAEAGRFGDLNTDRNLGPGIGIKADRLVWAIRYEGDMTICYPPGVRPTVTTCESPRPGTLTVFLDYFSGAFLMTDGFSPAH
jgi:hypothetical protein